MQEKVKIEEQFEEIINQILVKGFGVLANFLDENEIKLLNKTFSTHYQKQQFKHAGISKQQEIIKTVRGDEILWLEKETANEIEKQFLLKLENFISYLNTTCYLGLHDYEIHYATYPIGTFYKRHLDTFRSDSNRKLTIICYLNENWQPENGGQLMLYLANETLEVSPIGGTFVCFESNKIEHEVLPTFKERRSITGWLRK